MLLCGLLLLTCLAATLPGEEIKDWFIQEFSSFPTVSGITWPGDGLPLKTGRSDASTMYGILRRDGLIPAQVLLGRLREENPNSKFTLLDVRRQAHKLTWSLSVSVVFHKRLSDIVK